MVHGVAYRTLSTASQASVPPSKLHPTGPRSQSAQLSHLTFFPGPLPGACGGRILRSEGLEKPMLSNDMGEPVMCQYADCPSSPLDGGNGEPSSVGTY